MARMLGSSSVVSLGRAALDTMSGSASSRPSRDPTSELRAMASLSPSHGNAAELLTFGAEEEDLRRGVGLFQVMSNMGGIFKQAKGSEATYAMSQPVERLKGFLSHNWAVWRGYKFLALAMHYNMTVAVVGTAIFLCVHLVLAAHGLLPVFYHKRLGFDLTFIPNMLAPLVFMLLLLFVRELLAAGGQQGPVMFLDKVCISQTDAEAQANGIRNLGAFLTVSEKMVILHSDLYLKKLWTVYEVACFLSVRGVDDVVFLSVHQAKSFFIGLAATFAGGLLYFLISVTSSSVGLLVITPVVSVNMYAMAARKWSKDQASMAASLRTFTIRSCTCQEEADRALVYSSIDSFMKFQGSVPMDASLDDALDAFDLQVRRELPHALRKLIGGSGWSYQQILVMCYLCPAGPQLFEHYSFPWQLQLAIRLNVCICAFAVFPLGIVCIDRLMRAFSHLQGLQEAVWIILVATLVAMIAGACVAFGHMLTLLSADNWMYLIGQVALAALGPVLPWLLARRAAAGASEGGCRAATACEVRSPSGSEAKDLSECTSTRSRDAAAGASEVSAPEPRSSGTSEAIGASEVVSTRSGDAGAKAGEAKRVDKFVFRDMVITVKC